MDKTHTTESQEQNIPFAVYRSGIRVSEMTYNTKSDAKHEADYWRNILSRWPDGTKIDVRQVGARRQYKKESDS